MNRLANPYTLLSLSLSALILVSASVGIFDPSIYKEAFEWQVQAVWQDYVDAILMVPTLLISCVYAYQGSKTAGYTWAGTLLYLVYTYTIYAFDIHFNGLFLFYCLILGLSFYSLVWYFYIQTKHRQSTPKLKESSYTITATYFILLGCGFYILWLLQIVPAILAGSLPANLEKFELLTNPVHVLDLAVILPAFIITGIMVFSGKFLASVLTPVILIFAALMSLTIGGLQIAMYIGDVPSNLFFAVVMFFLCLLDLMLLRNLSKYEWKRMEKTSQQILNFN